MNKFSYYTFLVITILHLIGVGMYCAKIGQPRKPLTGVDFVIALIITVFVCIAMAKIL